LLRKIGINRIIFNHRPVQNRPERFLSNSTFKMCVRTLSPVPYSVPAKTHVGISVIREPDEILLASVFPDKRRIAELRWLA
jgi:hypothetical protein